MQCQSKSQQVYCMDIDNMNLKFIWRGKRPRIANIILKESKVGGLMVSDFKTCHRATVIKTVWYWWKNRQIDRWKRIGSSEIEPHKYSQLIFDKGTEAVQYNGAKIAYLTNGTGKLDIHLQK